MKYCSVYTKTIREPVSPVVQVSLCETCYQKELHTQAGILEAQRGF